MEPRDCHNGHVTMISRSQACDTANKQQFSNTCRMEGAKSAGCGVFCADRLDCESPREIKIRLDPKNSTPLAPLQTSLDIAFHRNRPLCSRCSHVRGFHSEQPCLPKFRFRQPLPLLPRPQLSQA